MSKTVRERLVDRLAEIGFSTKPEHLNSQEIWQRGPHWDLCVWWGVAWRDGVRRDISSWSTMTECAKKGIVIVPQLQGGGTYIEVCPR